MSSPSPPFSTLAPASPVSESPALPPVTFEIAYRVSVPRVAVVAEPGETPLTGPSTTVTLSPNERVVDGVGAEIPVDRVVAGVAEERVVPGAAREGVRAGVAAEDVGAAAAREVLEAGDGVGAGAAGDLGRGERERHGDAAGNAGVVERVGVGAAVEEVVAGAVEDRVVAVVAEDDVVARPPVSRSEPEPAVEGVVARPPSRMSFPSPPVRSLRCRCRS